MMKIGNGEWGVGSGCYFSKYRGMLRKYPHSPNRRPYSLLPTPYSLILLIMLFVIPACSTKPKNPGDIYELRRQAEMQLELGSRRADRGDFDSALLMLDTAMRLAVAADDPGLRIRAGLSRGNVLFSLERGEEAEKDWNDALREAENAGNSELAAISRIHIARGKLLAPADKTAEEKSAEEASAADKAAQAIRDEVSRNLSQIKSDRYYVAFAWTIVGLAENKLGRYAQAEAAARRALEIHEKDRYFELAAYDWFMIASFRSRASNYRGALEALEAAIALDRRVENSWGLASDWRAMGAVYQKSGNAEASRAAYQRAVEIFRALGNDKAAEETLSRSENGL